MSLDSSVLTNCHGRVRNTHVRIFPFQNLIKEDLSRNRFSRRHQIVTVDLLFTYLTGLTHSSVALAHDVERELADARARGPADVQGVRTQETRQQQGRRLRPAGAEALHPSLLFPPAAPPARRPPRVTLLCPGDLHHAQALQVPRGQGLSQTSQLGEFTSSRIRHVATHLLMVDYLK